MAQTIACLMVASSQTSENSSRPIEETVASLHRQPAKCIALRVNDLQMLAKGLQRKGKLNQAEQLLRQAPAILKKMSLHGTRYSAIVADLADVCQERGDDFATRDLLLEAVNRLADQNKYPSEHIQRPEFEAARSKRFRTLANRLIRVHQDLDDHEAASLGEQ